MQSRFQGSKVLLDPFLIDNTITSHRVSKELDDISLVKQADQTFILYDERIKCPVHKSTLKKDLSLPKLSSMLCNCVDHKHGHKSNKKHNLSKTELSEDNSS